MPLLVLNLHVANALLERIAVALERIAGPLPRLPAGAHTPRRTEASDVYVATDEFTDRVSAERTRAAREVLGAGAVLPGSEAEAQVIAALEEQVKEQYGEEAVKEFPWRKVERGARGA